MKFKTLDANTWLVVLSLVLSFILVIATFTLVTKDRQHDDEYLKYFTKLRQHSQEITQQATLAVRGEASAFETIANARAEYKMILDKLTKDTPPSTKKALMDLTNLWEKTESTLHNLLDTQYALLRIQNELTQIAAVTVELVEKTSDMIEVMKKEGATSVQLFLAIHQMMWLERIAHTVKMSAVEQLKEAITQFGQTLSILMSGGESNMGRN